MFADVFLVTSKSFTVFYQRKCYNHISAVPDALQRKNDFYEDKNLWNQF